MKSTARIVGNIEALLEREKMSQAQLARRAKVSATTLNRLMLSQRPTGAGARYSPTTDLVERIAAALGVSAAALLSEGMAEASSMPASPPLPAIPANPFTFARELGRLAEDFALSSDSDRTRILALAAECSRAKGTDGA